MSILRPECGSSVHPAHSRITVLSATLAAISKRRGLIHGALNGPGNRHCALGACWADNPTLRVERKLVDEIAAVNDAVPPTSTPKERLKMVRRWLRWQLRRAGAL